MTFFRPNNGIVCACCGPCEPLGCLSCRETQVSYLHSSSIHSRSRGRATPTAAVPPGQACGAVRSRKPTYREIDILAGRHVLNAAEPTLDGLPSFHDIYPRGLTDDLYLRDIVVEAYHDTRRIPIYSSARMMVTRNLHKEQGVVNDAVRHVLLFSRDCVVLRLDSDVEAAIHKMAYETEDGSNSAAYPLELGCTCTLANVQGDTIEKGLYVYIYIYIYMYIFIERDPGVGVPGLAVFSWE